MTPSRRAPLPIKKLRDLFGSRLQENVKLSNYTTAHAGGVADALLIAQDMHELEDAVQLLWQHNLCFQILGSGSNVLISDLGMREVIIINRARNIKVDAQHTPPSVWAESGANFGAIARQVALRGLSGLEWANSIPGTIGGAVYGNAGAHGSDMQHDLILAEILHRTHGKQVWTCEQMEFSYRSSILKRNPGQAVILAARLRLQASTPEEVKNQMDSFRERRKATQPTGASLGSMFKNPPGDYAGRLIEAAGLKGARIGGAHVSNMHANFFLNDKEATAQDIYQLIQLVQSTVEEKFGIKLELEVELLGEWKNEKN